MPLGLIVLASAFSNLERFQSLPGQPSVQVGRGVSLVILYLKEAPLARPKSIPTGRLTQR